MLLVRLSVPVESTQYTQWRQMGREEGSSAGDFHNTMSIAVCHGPRLNTTPQVGVRSGRVVREAFDKTQWVEHLLVWLQLRACRKPSNLDFHFSSAKRMSLRGDGIRTFLGMKPRAPAVRQGGVPRELWLRQWTDGDPE